MTTTKTNQIDFAALIAAAHYHDPALAEWLIRWLDGCCGAKAVRDRDEGWCLIEEPAIWYASDGEAEIECPNMTADEARAEYVDGGDWGEYDTTIWVEVSSYQRAIDDQGRVAHVNRTRESFSIDPDEPECVDDSDHDWQDRGMQCNGGGVVYREECSRCGCRRTVDTWAQDPETGEQGLESVSYEAAE